MVTVVQDEQAAAALAGVEIPEQGLLPDAVLASPSLILVELAVLICFRSAEVRAHHAFCRWQS